MTKKSVHFRDFVSYFCAHKRESLMEKMKRKNEKFSEGKISFVDRRRLERGEEEELEREEEEEEEEDEEEEEEK